MDNETYLQKKLPVESELKKILKGVKHPIFFDIGSCHGLDAIKYARLFPNAVVYAFEPLKKNYERTLRNVQRYHPENIKVFNLAISDKKGVLDFFVSSGELPNARENDEWEYGAESSSLLNPNKHLEVYPWVKFDKKESVESTTIQDFCMGNKLNKIDFIHMDVQGAELMVLKGAGELLKNVQLVWLEAGTIELYKNQPLKSEIERYMLQNKFVKVKDFVGEFDGNQLYINRKHLFKLDAVDFLKVVIKTVVK